MEKEEEFSSQLKKQNKKHKENKKLKQKKKYLKVVFTVVRQLVFTRVPGCVKRERKL